MTDVDLRPALDRITAGQQQSALPSGELVLRARAARRRRRVAVAAAGVLAAAVVGLGASVVAHAPTDHRGTVTPAFPGRWTDARVLERCQLAQELGNSEPAPSDDGLDGARVVRWQASATAMYAVLVARNDRHWATCAVFAPPAEFPGYVSWRSMGGAEAPDGLSFHTGARGFIFVGRFPAEVARVTWTVEGHTVTQDPDDGFVVVVIGEVTDMRPTHVFLTVYDADGNVLGQSGVKGGKEYDLPSRYLPVTD